MPAKRLLINCPVRLSVAETDSVPDLPVLPSGRERTASASLPSFSVTWSSSESPLLAENGKASVILRWLIIAR